jgi:hypothetical protein
LVHFSPFGMLDQEKSGNPGTSGFIKRNAGGRKESIQRDADASKKV